MLVYNPRMDDGALRTLGKYETRGIVGRGAMGIVYEGWDPIIARKVAIKTVALPDLTDQQTQDELARFRREAQAAGRLTHPNIVGIFDYGETDSLAYIVMEFVDGQTLKSVLDKGERLPVGETVRIIEELLTGLQYSHDSGVVHRDIKPANVILTRNMAATFGPGARPAGGLGTVKIADFGIARIESSSMTQAGTVLGTPAYMSPEQFNGETVDARSDIYSAGILLYQLLTGERPFEGGFSAIMHKALHTMPPMPSDFSVTAPPALDAVVARAIAKRPGDRFASAADFAMAVRRAYEAGPALLSPAKPLMDDPTTIIERPARTATPARAEPGAPPVDPPNRAALFVAVGLAGLVAVGGGTWFALRPSTVPAVVIAKPPDNVFASPISPKVIELTKPVGPATAPEPTPPVKPAPDKTEAMVQPPVDPSPTPPTPPPPAVSKSAVSAALAGVPCSLIGGDVAPPGETIVLNGLVGKGPAEEAARHAVADAAPGANIEWHVTRFDGPYCRILDLLRAQGPRFGVPASGFSLTLSGDRAVATDMRVKLHDGDLITLRMNLPEFSAQLLADYFQQNGTVWHMHPTVADGPRLYQAGSLKTLGDPAAGGARWEVGPPYGSDLVVAIASSLQLANPRRPQFENEDVYVRDLLAAIDSVRKRGGRIAVEAMILDTAAK